MIWHHAGDVLFEFSWWWFITAEASLTGVQLNEQIAVTCWGTGKRKGPVGFWNILWSRRRDGSTSDQISHCHRLSKEVRNQVIVQFINFFQYWSCLMCLHTNRCVLKTICCLCSNCLLFCDCLGSGIAGKRARHHLGVTCFHAVVLLVLKTTRKKLFLSPPTLVTGL